MQDLKSSDETYLLALAGLIPIQKLYRLEKLLFSEESKAKLDSELRNAYEDEMEIAINGSASSENYSTQEEVETSIS